MVQYCSDAVLNSCITNGSFYAGNTFVRGLGTRLRSVVSDRPKPLADINGRPFMEYVIRALMKHGIDDIIFAAGYMGKMIEEYFGDGSAFGFRAHYAYEESQLGTGGALRNALSYVTEPMVYALNADTFYKIDYSALLRLKEEKQVPMALVTREVMDISRYGEVRAENGLVTGWNEKNRGAARRDQRRHLPAGPGADRPDPGGKAQSGK